MSKKDQYLKLRRSAVPGKIPDTASIDFGEIALNTSDGLAFMKITGSFGEQVVSIGSKSGSFTGSFFGTASYAIIAATASYVEGFTPFQIATGSVTASVNLDPSKSFFVKSGSVFLFSVDSKGNTVTSGSITIETSGSVSEMLNVKNDNVEYLKINNEGVLVLHRFLTPPSAVSGGLYLDTTGNIYLGV